MRRMRRLKIRLLLQIACPCSLRLSFRRSLLRCRPRAFPLRRDHLGVPCVVALAQSPPTNASFLGMRITAIVENDTIRLPVHVPDGTSVEILLPARKADAASDKTGGAGHANYQERIAEARKQFAANCPWKTTADAMRELRAGEQN